MNDPVQLDRLSSLDALRGPSAADRAASTGAPGTDWFVADDAGARLPITLATPARHGAGDLDALGADILAPLAR